MANLHQPGKKQSKAKRNWKKVFWASSFALPVYFVLTVLLVTTIVPALAGDQVSQGERFLSATTFYQSNSQVQQLLAASQLLQQGKSRYEAGQFREAATLWEQAAQGYSLRQETLNQAQSLNYLASAYHQLGEWQQAQKTIDQSINLLQGVDKLEARGKFLLAQALNARGLQQLAKGETEAALETWKEAEAAYASAEDESGKLGSRMNQALAWQAMGQYRRAIALLEQVNAQMQAQPDTLLKADSLRSLGMTLQTIGDLRRAKQILEKSWEISDKLNSPADTSVTLFSIGNIARMLQKKDVAISYYEKAAQLATDDLTKVQAQVNQLSLLIANQQREAAVALIPQIQAKLANLSPSRDSIYARVNFAESLIKLAGTHKNSGQLPITNQNIAQILAIGVKQAKELGDRRAEAYALTEVGKLYELHGQWKDAEVVTEQVLQIVQGIEADDIVARAAWQLGRILQQEGEIKRAIAAYDKAFESLQSLRSDLVAINREIQFEFQESVEPIYREFASLLLTPPLNYQAEPGVMRSQAEPGNQGKYQAEPGVMRSQAEPGNQGTPHLMRSQAEQGTPPLGKGGQGGIAQANLAKARQVLEALQLAELDNFFGDACIKTKPVEIDQIDTTAAVIYPIILSDRLEVILSIPNQPLRHYATQLPRQEIEKTLQNFYSALFPAYSRDERLQLSKQIYDWLIQPGAADLASNNIKTLVFVPDGLFRNLPMAALYDGKQYLIEKYSVAISPGLQLFPEPLESKEFTVLAAALTEARQGFIALPAVEKEIKQISSEVQAQVLLNQQFTRASFQTAIEGKSFPVLHLATHGQFSSNQEETFILTWEDKIGIKDLDVLFQKSKLGIANPIELLVMSACQTAAGDRRATLGLAGFALRSGARSTLASLWSVNDESTSEMMSEFYRQLTRKDSKISKAEALRQAQLAVRKNPLHNQPYFWASFVLIGNWL
jgi:CHAT domain-containing protein